VRFPGEGAPRLRGYGRGDLYIEIDVRIPTQVTSKQEQLLREFAELDREKGEQKVRKWPWNRRKERSQESAQDASRQAHN
ncbi:MAG: molecular chaperone DnaJ, partial [Syntrophobacteraceae bacterium]|nr:molecular chaperone DnaJ [Syntrophobacteraceae bacterium]